MPDMLNNRVGSQAREPSKCLDGWSYVERLAKEKEIFKQIFIVNMVIMICIGTVLVKRGNVFLLAQEIMASFS